MAASRAASASAISRPCAGVHTPDALTHDRPPLSAIDVGDQVERVAPARRAIRAEQHLAVARAVQLDARIAGKRADGGDVAEEHAAAALPDDLAGAGVVARESS